jgi:hypothetical protein
MAPRMGSHGTRHELRRSVGVGPRTPGGTVTADLNAEQRSREKALYAALSLTIGNETYDACDVIDLAEYIRSGARGVPIEETDQIQHYSEVHDYAEQLDEALTEVRGLTARHDAMGLHWHQIEQIVGTQHTVPEATVEQIRRLVETREPTSENRAS